MKNLKNIQVNIYSLDDFSRLVTKMYIIAKRILKVVSCSNYKSYIFLLKYHHLVALLLLKSLLTSVTQNTATQIYFIKNVEDNSPQSCQYEYAIRLQYIIPNCIVMRVYNQEDCARYYKFSEGTVYLSMIYLFLFRRLMEPTRQNIRIF